MLPRAKPVAERVLSELWGNKISLGQNEKLGGSNRSNVYRFPVLPGSTELPKSIVVKQARELTNESYDPEGTEGPAWRLFNDWAGLQFLTELAGADSPTPQFYGGDREAGIVILEDLGQGTQLDHLLLGNDSKAAEHGLLGLMTALGRLHALTIGHQSTFEALRDRLGPRVKKASYKDIVAQQQQAFLQFIDGANVRLRSNLTSDFKTLEGFLNPDNPFMAYSHHDPCPDNCLFVGQTMKLLDFEFSGFRHALLDGVYGRIHFPTCWCVNRLPDHVYHQMEQVYRQELAQGCPEVLDDEVFNRVLVEACTWQMLRSLFIGVLEEDGQWGISTHRQRALLRLSQVAEITQEVGHLKELGATAGDLAETLHQEWAIGLDEMPLYPAFRGQEDAI